MDGKNLSWKKFFTWSGALIGAAAVGAALDELYHMKKEMYRVDVVETGTFEYLGKDFEYSVNVEDGDKFIRYSLEGGKSFVSRGTWEKSMNQHRTKVLNDLEKKLLKD